MKYFASVGHSLGVLFRHKGWSWEVAVYAWRSAVWYLLVAVGREPRVCIREWPGIFVLPSLWRTPAKLFYVFRRDYEPEIQLIEDVVTPGDWVIDIGANFGLYTILAGRKVGPQGRVLAFEPFPSSFQMLRRNCRLNHLEDTTRLWECALGETSTTAALSVHDDPGRNTLGSLGAEEVSRVEIPVRRLDKLQAEEPFARIDLIKMDVEGFELQVLRGARGVIGKFQPIILFELNPPVCLQNGYQSSEIVTFLEDAGYLMFQYAGRHELREVRPEEYGNYVGIHRERLTDPRFGQHRLHRLE